MPVDLIADTFVSISAVVGLLILRAMLKTSARTPVTVRFLFGIDVVAVLMFTRVLFWLTGNWIFATAVVIAAGLIPLATLLLCEGLLQRHAPRLLKWVAAGGALAFLVLAFVDPQSLGVAIGLVVLQTFVFFSAGYLVLTRDRDSLSAAENGAVERIGLSLLLILPFAITDYRSELIDTPVRLSGIAVLFLCWLSVSLRRGGFNHREVQSSFLILLCVPIVAGLVIAGLAEFDVRTAFQVTAIIVSAAVLSSLAIEARALRRERERASLLRYVAGSTDDPETFLSGLQSQAAVADAVILKGDELHDFDESFRDALRRHPVRRLSDLGQSDFGAGDEQLRWFFEKYAATHVLLAADDPFTVVALNIPTLSQSPSTEAELQIVQRMAHLLSARAAA